MRPLERIVVQSEGPDGTTLADSLLLTPARLIEAYLNLDAATIVALRRQEPIIVNEPEPSPCRPPSAASEGKGA